MEPASLDYSVIIPTYQRREVILKSVCSLAKQDYPGSFEVIIVVDGSTDGTAGALRKLDTPFPLKIIEQPNRGAATARNQGAAAACGEILLFLDDDMICHPALLAEHDRSHRAGADVVMGHIPLHPDAPQSILTPGVRDWAEQRAQKLSARGAALTLHDLLTGQLSLPKEIFFKVGGFDTHFTYGGSFGNEDVDFGYRLLLGGYRIVFNPKAISWQYYVVSPSRYLRQWRQAGAADVIFARLHPEEAENLFRLNGSDEWMNRVVWRRVSRWPIAGSAIVSLLHALSLALVERGVAHPYAVRLFRQAKRAGYWRGVQQAGGLPGAHPLRILAYHSIADLSGAPVLGPYGVPPEIFRRQLELLLQLGFHFVTAGEAVRFLQGRGGLPGRAVLLTFDDCYQELLEVVLPVLKEKGIPAVAFAVSGCLGKTNEWDSAIGGEQRRLLDAEGLLQLSQEGIEIGAHTRTHPALTRLPDEALSAEIAGSVADLENLGIPRPQLFAYPYGESDRRVHRAVQDAGLRAAFTIDPGLATSGQDLYLVPRIEIGKADVGWKLWSKVLTGGRLFSAV